VVLGGSLWFPSVLLELGGVFHFFVFVSTLPFFVVCAAKI